MRARKRLFEPSASKEMEEWIGQNKDLQANITLIEQSPCKKAVNEALAQYIKEKIDFQNSEQDFDIMDLLEEGELRSLFFQIFDCEIYPESILEEGFGAIGEALGIRKHGEVGYKNLIEDFRLLKFIGVHPLQKILSLASEGEEPNTSVSTAKIRRLSKEACSTRVAE